jgi:hypothetical protein
MPHCFSCIAAYDQALLALNETAVISYSAAAVPVPEAALLSRLRLHQHEGDVGG